MLVDSESGSVGGYTNLVIGNGLGLGILFDATDQPTQWNNQEWKWIAVISGGALRTTGADTPTPQAPTPTRTALHQLQLI